ncbi:MAG: glycosyltransferase family 39 protein [Candidatus Binatia bacterium]
MNLIKAALLSRGYPLYASIWSDQPPLLTHVLGWLIAACGHSVVVPRLLMALASSAFVWGVGRHLHRRYSLPHALAAQTFILAQPVFYLFSGAIMVGLPAIYLAFAAVFALIHATETQQSRWLTLSAVLLAISILFKLFTAVVVPVAALFLATAALARTGDPGRGRWWVDPLRWTLVLAACLVVLFTLFVGWENGSQLVAGHLRARSNPNVGEWAQRTLWLHLGRVRWLMAPAIVGGAIALFQRDRAMLVFVGWGTLAALGLSVHFPVWMHQQMLVTLPAAVVAGFGAGELLSRSMRLLDGSALQSWLVEPRAIVRGLGAGAMLAGCCVFIAFAQRGMWRTPPNDTFRPQSTDPAVVQLLREMEWRGREDPLVITDRPMLAYRAGLDVPAWIAALTRKRLTTGQLSEADLIAEIENYQPAQVVLARLPLPAVREFLDRTYHLQYSNLLGALYLRPSAAARPERPPSADHEWRIALHRPASWYGGGEARRLAATVLATQGPNGGWPKGRAVRAAGPRRKDESDETLDNQSTTSQLRFLRLMLAVDDDAAYRAALQRGVDYLLRSQCRQPPPDLAGG